jgi:hypothetical protein
VNRDLRHPGYQGAEGIAGPLTNFLSAIVEVPVNMVQNFAQPPAARFAEDFGLPSCDARASMITNSADATSSTAVEEPAPGATTPSISEQSTIAASTTSADSQDMPTMKNQHGFGSTVLANTSYTGRRFVNWIVQVPMGVTLGLSQGFHEAPRWYGDRTVRDFPKVKGLRSGFVAAGKVSYIHREASVSGVQGL